MKNPKPNTTPPPLVFTHDELVVLNNALNEICNGVSFDDDEFQTRIGYSRAMAQNLLKKIAKGLGK
jgi:hypothetical protein